MSPDCRVQEQRLELREQMAETVFLGLRMAEGVNLREFERIYGVSAEEIYGEAIRECVDQELLERKGEFLLFSVPGTAGDFFT